MGFLMKRMGGSAMGVGKITAKVYGKQTGVTFKDVAGQDEAKESLQEVVDFLHNPKKSSGDRRQNFEGCTFSRISWYR